MPLWKVELDGRQTLIQARTKEAAIREAVYGYFGSIRATEATEQDINWQNAMSGSTEQYVNTFDVSTHPNEEVRGRR